MDEWKAKKWVCKLTAKLAATSVYDVFRHGAVIYKSGRILGKGVNSPIRKNTRHNDYYSIHAEAAAIKNAGTRHVRGATIYVARDSNTGLRNSKPCEMCELLIKASGIKQVVYSIGVNEWAVKDP